jgi:hypothetical protein
MIVPLGNCHPGNGNVYTRYYIDKKLHETYDQLVLKKSCSSADKIMAQKYLISDKTIIVSIFSYWFKYVRARVISLSPDGFCFSCLCGNEFYQNIIEKYPHTPFSNLITHYNEDLQRCAEAFAEKTLNETLFVRYTNTTSNQVNKPLDTIQAHVAVPQVMETFHTEINNIMEKIKQDYNAQTNI